MLIHDLKKVALSCPISVKLSLELPTPASRSRLPRCTSSIVGSKQGRKTYDCRRQKGSVENIVYLIEGQSVA